MSKDCELCREQAGIKPAFVFPPPFELTDEELDAMKEQADQHGEMYLLQHGHPRRHDWSAIYQTEIDRREQLGGW